MFELQLPEYVQFIIERLENSGYEAYAVGGCIRDSLLGITPGDWDLCTSAFPEQTMEVFKDMKVIPTGLKHGTVTVVMENDNVEITTFRTDGTYSDSRHPDNVKFVRNLEEDLARRDFTMNALAYSHSKGLIDLYGGYDDLKNDRLKCVGDADKRLSEDALRIMRALRFMTRYELAADEALHDAIMNRYETLRGVSYERISSELVKFLNGKKPAKLLDEYRDVFCFVIPELRAMIGFDQKSPYHNRDVWNHTLCAVDDIPPKGDLRLIMLLHDIAKPVVFILDDNGRGRFVGHQKKGAEMAEVILRRMKFSNETIQHVAKMIGFHDLKIRPERPQVRKWLGVLGRSDFDNLLLIKHADASGKYEKYEKQAEENNAELARIADSIEAENDCISLSGLKIDGSDVISEGIAEGRGVGEVLEWLLDEVINDRLPNERAALLSACRTYKSSGHGQFV